MELKSTYDECIWLWNTLGLDSKQDLQSGEVRLLQFANVVDIMVLKIFNLLENNFILIYILHLR